MMNWNLVRSPSVSHAADSKSREPIDIAANSGRSSFSTGYSRLKDICQFTAEQQASKGNFNALFGVIHSRMLVTQALLSCRRMLKHYHTLLFLLLSTLQVAAQNDSKSSGNYKWIENKGQWPSEVLFSAEIESGNFYIKDSGFLLDFRHTEDMAAIYAAHASASAEAVDLPESIRAHAYALNFEGSNQVQAQPSDLLPGTFNYFKGNDSSKWGRNCSAFGSLSWTDLYPGIDLELYSNDFFMKYDFIVKPFADPASIRMSYEGADDIALKNGRLVITTSVNQVTEQKPICYQIINGVKDLVSAKFILEDGVVGFEITEAYDKSQELIIDPELIFSSYSGSFSNNFGYTATFDDLGFLYSGSSAFGAQYPVTTGAYEINFQQGIVDMALSKWDSSGTFLVWSSYLGGSSDELPHSLYVNSNRELFVYGTTSSLNFPTTPNAYDQSFNGGAGINLLQGLGVNYTNGSDIVVSRFSADGSDLLASTYIGGSDNDGLNSGTPLRYNYADEIRGEILIDHQNNIYIASSTNSNNFPTTASAFQSGFGGGLQDGCIFKLDNNLSNLLWSSYIGGSSNDAVYALDIDVNDDVILCGGTQSNNFPITFGTEQQAYGGGLADGFISKINSSGSAILLSTFRGSAGYDQVYFVEVDAEQNIYVFGQTENNDDFYIVNAAYGTAASGQFISKYESDLSTLVWSTAFGTGSGAPNISPTAFLVDLCDKIYLSGWGSQIQGGPLTVAGMDVTPDAYQSTTTGNDFYLFVLEDDASDIFYGSFYGGNSSSEHVDGGTSRFDRKGVMYQAVCAGCGGNDDFPIKPNPGALSEFNNNNCNLGVFKFDFNIPVTIADFFAPDLLCTDTAIDFDNLSNGALSYFWNFGDDSTSDAFEPSHSYAEPGTYQVMLVANDPATCNEVDTVYQTITILSNSSRTIESIEACLGESIQIGIEPSVDPSITYSWSPAEFLSNPDIANPFYLGDENAEYILQISNGVCIDTVFQTVNLTALNLIVPDDIDLCEEGTELTLTASSDLDDTAFTWSLNSDFSDPLNDGPDDPDIELIATGSATYYIQVSSEFCEQTDQVQINFSSSQTEVIGDRTICPGDTVSLYVLEPSESLEYSWSPEDFIISGQNTSSILVAPTVPTTYTVVSTNTEGCEASDSVDVLFSSLGAGSAQAAANPQIIISGQSSQLSALPSGYDYLWNPSSTLNNPFAQNPIATPLESTTYHLQISDGECVFFDSTRVQIVDFVCGPPIIYVPNAFTPNSDAKNEMLFVRGLNLTRVHLEIYNRWGEMVFETNDQSKGWDGSYKGKACDPAVFVYYLEADCGDGESYFEKGNITLIR